MALKKLFQSVEEQESFSAGDYIFREGETGTVMYGVSEGEVDITLAGKVLETVGPGGMVGEMALIDDKERSAAVVAKTDCRLAPINKECFTFLVQETPYFALEVMRVMADRLRRMDKILRSS